MLNNMLIVGEQVVILFILIAIGFTCNKIKIFGDRAIRDLTDFVLYFVSPTVIIDSYNRAFEPDKLTGLLITVAAAFASFAINIVIANLIVHDKDKRREKTMRFGAVFSNCGYMSLPLQNALLGADGVFYGATYIAIFNLVLWTYGIILMDGGIKNISLKRIFLNPNIIGIIAGFLIFIFSVPLPNVISEPIGYLASLNTPIPMVIIGYHLANAGFEVKGASAYVSMVFRLIVSPLIMMIGLRLCGISGTVLVASTVAAAAPLAAVTTMFAEKFDGDTALSAACVSVTTLVSIITMPLIVGIAMNM